MICPCPKKGETSVVDSRSTEDGHQLEDEGYVFVVRDLPHLREFKLEH